AARAFVEIRGGLRPPLRRGCRPRSWSPPGSGPAHTITGSCPASTAAEGDMTMTARIATAVLVGISPMSQSRAHDEEKIDDKESPEAYDRRTWRSKAHFDPVTREVYIPPMALKLAIAEAARRLAIKIPGKRNATYSK